MIFFSTLLLAMFITLVLIPIFKSLATRLNAVDFPNIRKVHTHPTPKIGGISMALGVLMPALLWMPESEFASAVMIGAGIVFVCGFIDDIKTLGYRSKFIAQIAAALLVILYGGIKIKRLGMLLPDGILLPEWIAIPLTLIVIVGVTNAINLSDGLDGLAGGMSLFIFVCIGYLAYQGGNISIALFSIAICGAVFGFLRFNTYPATVFMGDAGSQFLGFLAATLALSLTQGSTPLSPLLPLILLGFPVLDTLSVMHERIADGKSPFVADKNHFHHKLMRLGLFHTEAVFVIYLIQGLLVTSAFTFRFYSEWFLLFIYMIFSGITLSIFYIKDKTGRKLSRFDFVDKVIKPKLRVLKEKSVVIKLTFGIVAAGTPLLLLCTCFIPKVVPVYFSIISICIAIVIMLTWWFKKKWMQGALRLALYLMIPLLIYLSEADTVPWVTEKMKQIYDLSFGFLVFFVVFTLKFTRRQQGFRSTPTDFLILFIVLVVPILPDEQIRSYHIGFLAAKIIALFFSYEVLIGELRNELNRLGLATVAALLVISIRGFVY